MRNIPIFSSLTVLWMLTYAYVYSRVDTKPTSCSSRWTRKMVFYFSDLLTKTYLLTYKSYILTHDVIGSGVAFFGRERNLYITQWNYICEMTGTIKNILNDRRTVGYAVWSTIDRDYIIIHASKYYALARRATTKKLLKCMHCRNVHTVEGITVSAVYINQ